MSDMDGYETPDVCRVCGESTLPCACPSDADAPLTCLHGRTVDDYCPDCAVEAEMQLAGAVVRAMDRIQREQDERLGAALAARFGGHL